MAFDKFPDHRHVIQAVGMEPWGFSELMVIDPTTAELLASKVTGCAGRPAVRDGRSRSAAGSGAGAKPPCYFFNHGSCTNSDATCRFAHILVSDDEKAKMVKPVRNGSRSTSPNGRGEGRVAGGAGHALAARSRVGSRASVPLAG